MPILWEQVFSKSPEVGLTAQKKPTKMFISLWNEAGTERMEDKTVYVGTTILVRTGLFREPWYTGLDGKRHIIYHRLNTGAWEKIFDRTVTGNFAEVKYTPASAGKHSFYSEFPGDAEYEGCSKAVRVFAR